MIDTKNGGMTLKPETVKPERLEDLKSLVFKQEGEGTFSVLFATNEQFDVFVKRTVDVQGDDNVWAPEQRLDVIQKEFEHLELYRLRDEELADE